MLLAEVGGDCIVFAYFDGNPVNTLLIMRGAVAAQLESVFDRYVDEVFHHMWAEFSQRVGRRSTSRLDWPVWPNLVKSSSVPRREIDSVSATSSRKRKLASSRTSEKTLKRSGYWDELRGAAVARGEFQRKGEPTSSANRPNPEHATQCRLDIATTVQLVDYHPRKRGKTSGGMILRFSGGRESDSFWEWRRPGILTVCRTPS
jgi:hypothetical protein